MSILRYDIYFGKDVHKRVVCNRFPCNGGWARSKSPEAGRGVLLEGSFHKDSFGRRLVSMGSGRAMNLEHDISFHRSDPDFRSHKAACIQSHN